MTARTMSARDAAALLRPRDSLAVPLGPGQPPELLHALGERDDWQRLEVFAALLIDAFPLFARPGVSLRSGFFGPVERGLRAAGFDIEFVPADFRRFSSIARELAPRVMATAVAPGHGPDVVSLSLHAGATVDELRRCGRDPDRVLIAELNPRLPRTLGIEPDHPHTLSLDEIDVVIESSRDPFTLPSAEVGETERRIAEHALRFLHDGSTLQTGIGGVPDWIVRRLAEGGGGDFGIHTEMFTTGLMHLVEAGKVSNRKGLYDGFAVATFAAGTPELYDWLHDNERVRFLPVEAVNAPHLISRNRDMVSINGALSVDLAGQVAADALGGTQYSGIGGHEDFAAGAGRGFNGRSLICLPSSATVAGERVSRIVDHFPAGTLVTTPRHQVDVIVTEYGAAELGVKSARERVEALIAVADPEFRASLREQHEARLA